MIAINATGIRAYTYHLNSNDFSSFVRISNKFSIIFMFLVTTVPAASPTGKNFGKTAAAFAVLKF